MNYVSVWEKNSVPFPRKIARLCYTTKNVYASDALSELKRSIVLTKLNSEVAATA